CSHRIPLSGAGCLAAKRLPHPPRPAEAAFRRAVMQTGSNRVSIGNAEPRFPTRLIKQMKVAAAY
ncbi:MAG: hypothetical protein ABGW82_01900, partial [Paracoccus sp. (in: a-proteobacteria)]